MNLAAYPGKRLVDTDDHKKVYEYTFNVNVDSQDGKNHKTYTIVLYKEANNDTSINPNSVTVHGVSATVDPNDDSIYHVELENRYTKVERTNVSVTPTTGSSRVTWISDTINLSTENPNIFSYSVTSEDGTVKNYEIHITRKKSTNNTLTKVNLTVDGETNIRNCNFDNGATTCKIEVPTGTTGYTIEAVLPEGATINPDNNTHYDMGEDKSDSIKNYTFTVTAEDGTPKTYTITVERLKSSDNLLKTLETNAGSNNLIMVPNFTDGVTENYNVTIPSTQRDLTIHALANSKTATITSTEYQGIPSDEITINLSGLEYGEKVVEITVTAENNTTKKYQLTITREENNEPRLSMITINNNPINDYLTGTTFDRDPSKPINDTTYEYTLDIFDYSMPKITIDATHMDTEHGTISGLGEKPIKTIYYGTTYESGNTYVNDIIIRSTAHNGDYKDYTLHITRKANNNAEVDSVFMNYNGSNHSATKNGDIFEITVPNEVKIANDQNVIVNLQTPAHETLPEDAKAKITMAETSLRTDDPTNQNENIHKFTVTSEDGSTIKEYTMKITRELSTDTTLSDIRVLDATTKVNVGSFNPGFGSMTSYTVSVPVSTTKIKLEADLHESHQKILTDLEEEIDLSTNNQKTIIIEVESEAGTTGTYTLNIKRQESDINTLKILKIKSESGDYYPVNTIDSTHFTVEIPGTIDKVLMEAESDSPVSTIIYNGVDLDTTNTYTIQKGKNNKTFTITSESGLSQEYYVEITKLAKTDATLKKLTYKFQENESEIEIPLIDGQLEYTLNTVSNEINQIIIGGNATDEPDAVVKNGFATHPLNTGKNEIEIVVEAEDKTITNTYKIIIEREKNKNAYLSTLTSINPFEESLDLQNTFTYTMYVDETKETLSETEITAMAEVSTSKVELLSGELNLSTTTENIYEIKVTAEDETITNTYQIKVIRPKSTDATLKNIILTNGVTLKETFDPSQNTYTLQVPYGVETFEITGEKNVSVAIVGGNGTYNATDQPTITLTVTAEDPNTPINTYTFTIEILPSNETTLTSLEVVGYPFTDGTNEVVFEENKDTYSIGNIKKAVDKVTINTRLKNENATVTYWIDQTEITNCHQQATCEVPLKNELGDNQIEVKILAVDNQTEASYYINYTKINSDNKEIGNIEAFDIDGNQLSITPNIDETIKDYVIRIPYDKDFVKITVTPKENVSKVFIDNEETATKEFSNLVEGNTIIPIQIEAQDQSTKDYTITIERSSYIANTDATLTDLTVANGLDTSITYPITPNFGTAPDDTYSIGEIPYSLTTLEMTVTKNDEHANVTYIVNDGVEQSGPIITIPKENGTIKIKVLAEDNTTEKIYTITYTKTPSTTALLSDITLNKSVLNPGFNENTFEYTIELGKDDGDNIEITPTLKDGNATMTLNGEDITSGAIKLVENLVDGENIITINVTAEDGVTKQDYIIKINKTSETEKITSLIYGHTIDDDYIRTVKDEVTPSELKDQLDNENTKLFIYKEDGTETSEDEYVGTGMIVKLIEDGKELDSKIIIVLGDTTGDGMIDTWDDADVLNHFVGRTNASGDPLTLTGAKFIAADVNGDGVVDTWDDADILNHFVGRSLIHQKTN